MKRFLTFVAVLLAVLYALSGGGRSGADRDLFRIGRALGLDLSAGTLLRIEDSHGGFHGDGLRLAEVTVEGLVEKLANAGGWRPLPMSDSAAQALRLCEAEEETVEETAEGFYYFYDRHSECEDPYDSTQMHSRFSYNFTMAVYDNGNGRLYFYELDT